VSYYGLDDRAIGVRSFVQAKNFFCSLCVQTGSEAHPASCPMGTGVLSPGLKHGWGVTQTTHPHLVPSSRMSRSYTSSPPIARMACSGRAFALISFYITAIRNKIIIGYKRRNCAQSQRKTKAYGDIRSFSLNCFSSA
jgi:hypothetical protein